MPQSKLSIFKGGEGGALSFCSPNSATILDLFVNYL